MTPRRLSELAKAERRRAWLRTAAALVLVWVVLVTAFYLAPAGVIPSHKGAGIVVRLTIGIAVFAAILAAQARQIVRSDLPELRAVQALGVVVPLFLVVFATVYLSLSNASAVTFTEQLDHTRALYFTVTVFSTVGFGDITPKTDLARIVVSLQMLLDLVIIGAVVRLLFNAAQAGLARAREPSDGS